MNNISLKYILIGFAVSTFSVSCTKETDTTKTSSTPEHFIGELYGGGIIVEVNKNAKGEQHGLIASLSDVSQKTAWSAGGAAGAAVTNATSVTDGVYNSQLIKLTLGDNALAYKFCANLNDGNKTDWYFPSINEMLKLYYHQNIVNQVLETDNDVFTMKVAPEIYWTSTELESGAAHSINMVTGKIEFLNKQAELFRVRAFRRF
jgi:hypothetical protein